MRYSLGRYSLPAVGTDIAITCAVSERLNCMAKFGSNLIVDNKFAEQIAGRVVLTLAYSEGLQVEEVLTASATGDIAINLGGMAASETLGCAATGHCRCVCAAGVGRGVTGSVLLICRYEHDRRPDVRSIGQ